MDPDFLHGAPPTGACAAFIKESRMKFVNARELDRKSGGAKPRDLRFRGPLLETRNNKGEVGVSMRIQ